MADLTLVLDTGTNKVKATASGGVDGMLPPTSMHGGLNASSGNLLSNTFVSEMNDAGTLTATVWKSVLSVTGRGVLRLAGIRQASIGSQSVGIRLTIDGILVRSFDNATNVNAGAGAVIVGSTASANAPTPIYDLIPFSSGFEIEVRSSIDRTAGSSAQWFTNYYLTS